MEGDLVLVRVTAFKGEYKIQDKWEEEGYFVKSHPYGSIAVYGVRPVIGGNRRVLHRKLLLLLGSKVEESLVNQSHMKQKSKKNVNFQPTENLVEISSESDSEKETLLVSGPQNVIPKKGNDATVAESGSETDDTFQDGDISKDYSPDKPLDTLFSASNVHFSCFFFRYHSFQFSSSNKNQLKKMDQSPSLIK